MWTVAVSGTKQCRFSFENGVVWTGPKRGQLHFFLGGGGHRAYHWQLLIGKSSQV